MNRLMLVSAAVAATLCLALAGGAEVASAAQPGGPNPRACEHAPRANRDHGQQRANPSAVNCIIEDLPGF